MPPFRTTSSAGRGTGTFLRAPAGGGAAARAGAEEAAAAMFRCGRGKRPASVTHKSCHGGGARTSHLGSMDAGILDFERSRLRSVKSVGTSALARYLSWKSRSASQRAMSLSLKSRLTEVCLIMSSKTLSCRCEGNEKVGTRHYGLTRTPERIRCADRAALGSRSTRARCVRSRLHGLGGMGGWQCSPGSIPSCPLCLHRQRGRQGPTPPTPGRWRC